MGNGDTTQETAATTAAGRTRPWLIASVAAIGWGIFTIVVLHLISSHNPVLDTLSSYAFTDRGTGMLAASVLALSLGSLTLLGGLLASGVPISRTTGTFFGTWSGGLALAAIFPASYPENPNPVSGNIHQYSCVIAFLSVPAIGFSILDRLRELPGLERHRRLVSRWTMLSTGTLVLFGLSYLLGSFGNAPVLGRLSAILPVGFAQRTALAVNLALLFSLMLLAKAAASVLLAGPQVAAFGQVDQRSGRFAGVDRIKHDALSAGKQA